MSSSVKPFENSQDFVTSTYLQNINIVSIIKCIGISMLLNLLASKKPDWMTRTVEKAPNNKIQIRNKYPMNQVQKVQTYWFDNSNIGI